MDGRLDWTGLVSCGGYGSAVDNIAVVVLFSGLVDALRDQVRSLRIEINTICTPPALITTGDKGSRAARCRADNQKVNTNKVPHWMRPLMQFFGTI
jgi:hypothetical protein